MCQLNNFVNLMYFLLLLFCSMIKNGVGLQCCTSLLYDVIPVLLNEMIVTSSTTIYMPCFVGVSKLVETFNSKHSTNVQYQINPCEANDNPLFHSSCLVSPEHMNYVNNNDHINQIQLLGESKFPFFKITLLPTPPVQSNNKRKAAVITNASSSSTDYSLQTPNKYFVTHQEAADLIANTGQFKSYGPNNLANLFRTKTMKPMACTTNDHAQLSELSLSFDPTFIQHTVSYNSPESIFQVVHQQHQHFQSSINKRSKLPATAAEFESQLLQPHTIHELQLHCSNIDSFYNNVPHHESTLLDDSDGYCIVASSGGCFTKMHFDSLPVRMIIPVHSNSNDTDTSNGVKIWFICCGREAQQKRLFGVTDAVIESHAHGTNYPFKFNLDHFLSMQRSWIVRLQPGHVLHLPAMMLHMVYTSSAVIALADWQLNQYNVIYTLNQLNRFIKINNSSNYIIEKLKVQFVKWSVCIQKRILNQLSYFQWEANHVMYHEIQQLIVDLIKLSSATTLRPVPKLSLDESSDDEPQQQQRRRQGEKKQPLQQLSLPSSLPSSLPIGVADTTCSFVTSETHMSIGNQKVPVKNIQPMHDSTREYQEGKFDIVAQRLKKDGYLYLRDCISHEHAEKSLEAITKQLHNLKPNTIDDKLFEECTINMETGEYTISTYTSFWSVCIIFLNFSFIIICVYIYI